MRSTYAPVAGVHFNGFAESLDEVYAPGSILLAPAFLSGGVKTKVIEALASGVMAVGNSRTFEGLGLDSCSLAMDESDIRKFIADPASHIDELSRSTAKAHRYLRELLGEPAVRARWAAAIGIVPAGDCQALDGHSRHPT
jgi:glycosyltransferase involved in cell wall biosynthesis